MPLSDPQLLTCSYVLLNKPSSNELDLPVTPTFCNTLFDAPQNTITQMIPDGFEIGSPGKRIFRRFIFRPAKIELVVDSPELLVRTFGRIQKQIERWHLALDIQGYGLNYEFDFKAPGSQGAEAVSVEDWLGDRFALPGLAGLKKGQVALRQIHVVLNGVGNLKTLKLEPRVGVDGRIFSYANLNFDGKHLLTGEKLEWECTEGYKKAQEAIANLLGIV